MKLTTDMNIALQLLGESRNGMSLRALNGELIQSSTLYALERRNLITKTLYANGYIWSITDAGRRALETTP